MLLRCRNFPLFALRIETTMEPYTNDVQVRRDGTVDHAVVLFTTVSCQINLFNYPFVVGSCPVAINGWSQKSKTEITRIDHDRLFLTRGIFRLIICNRYK